MSPKLEDSKLDLIAPGLIVAMPQMLDENFSRCVVLMLKSSEEGAFGLVLNQGSGIPVGEFCRDQEIDYRGPEDLVINVGGPVEQNSHLLVLHGEDRVLDSQADDEEELAPGIWLVSAMDGLRTLAERGSERFRCYLGYSGWGPGQLEWELSEGVWVPLPCEKDFVFAEPGPQLWERALRRAGIDPISLVPGASIN